MGDVSLIYQRTPGRIGALELDATLTETHSAENEVTEHPVETGVNIADHIRPKPKTLTLRGIISNAPITRAQRDNAATLAAQGSLGRAESAYTQLLALADGGTTVQVATSLKVYEAMAIKSLSIPRDIKTGDVVDFTATFTEVRVVSSKVVDVTNLLRAKKAAELGKKPAAPAAQPEKRVSILRQILDHTTGL